MCGACKEKEEMPPPATTLSLEDMAEKTLAFETTASLHRLNQKPGANRKPNNSLAKANFANLQKSQASARHKSEIIRLYVCLWIREGGKAQKAGLDSLYFSYQNSENLSTVLADIQKHVKEAYEASSIGKASNFMGEYNFDQPTYSVGSSTNAVHLHITEALAAGSMQAFFSHCQTNRMLVE
ncbi:uncharacterized protein ARMOST_02283 [Armillaria ostoyae]|uniref:Uncharacterized protein n=1 Tax=Armillaria ostoyae TaxID=47428 RepID=A0A284QRA9_ARMOS|nr:uncharacterized protein ARMOST_02283 [Armillaria ostoyae]